MGHLLLELGVIVRGKGFVNSTNGSSRTLQVNAPLCSLRRLKRQSTRAEEIPSSVASRPRLWRLLLSHVRQLGIPKLSEECRCPLVGGPSLVPAATLRMCR